MPKYCKEFIQNTGFDGVFGVCGNDKDVVNTHTESMYAYNLNNQNPVHIVIIIS